MYFHGNEEAVADYVPEVADELASLGLNSLFDEYRQYGGSTGKARLVAMLGDGEAALAGLLPYSVPADRVVQGLEKATPGSKLARLQSRFTRWR